jgi:hypothetical protein
MGIVDISAADYHADKVADAPSLSASVANILLNCSPLHAWHAHPRLNPDFVREDEDRFSVGTVAHALFLQGEDVAVVVDAADWRTKAAKEERDAARAAGQVPLLAHQWDAVRTMVDAIRVQVDRFPISPPLFTNGKPERTLVWEEPSGVVGRARADWLHLDGSAIDDLKTTGASASPEAWSRTMLGFGADVQQAWYQRGARALMLGDTPEFRFVAVETRPPHALTVFSLAPDALAAANAKVEYALMTWRQCLASGDWPGYPRRVCYIQSPAWAENQWAEREYRDEREAA